MDTYGITVVRNQGGDPENGQSIVLDMTGDAAMVLASLTPLHQRMTAEVAAQANGTVQVVAPTAYAAPVAVQPTTPATQAPSAAADAPKRRGRPPKNPQPVTTPAPATTPTNPFGSAVG